jgi:hypothetical protein
MEEEKSITITTKISIEELINDVAASNPTSVCEFNNLLIYNFLNTYLERLRTQLEQQSGGKMHIKKRGLKLYKLTKKYIKKGTKARNTRNARNSRNSRNARNKRIQKGGLDPRILFFFMSMLITFVRGVKNMTDSDVITRIKSAASVSELFKNYHGTCALNTFLFLKTIDLPTFEDLSVDMITNKPGMTKVQMSPFLNKELNLNSRWYSFSGMEGDIDELTENFVERVKSRLIGLRSVYGYESTQSVITALSYKRKQIQVSHSVVVWLSSNNEITIIDPQRFVKNGIALYTSDPSPEPFMFGDKQLKHYSIRKYIKDYIDLTNEFGDTYIFESIHIELDDIHGLNALSPSNKRVNAVIARIKEIEAENKHLERIEEL